jgi:thiol-disulfide isomerase/thioredoxin
MKKRWVLGCLMVFALNVKAEDAKILGIGEAGPDFKLFGTDDQTYTLESFKESKVLMIVFTANHCPTAQAYEERMKKLSSDYKPGEMQMVAISSNYPDAVCLEELGYSDLGDTFEEMKIRAKDVGYNFPYLYDGETQEVAHAYGATATPHVFILDAERKLRYRGRIDDMEDPYQKPTHTDARNAVDALLAGSEVAVETTRAFGCSMKWKSKMDWKKKLDSDWANTPIVVDDLELEGLKEVISNKSEKIRLINVWATWCGPCVIEFPDLVNMQRMYGARDFEVVGISVDQPNQKEKVVKFLEEKEGAFTNYIYTPSDKEPMFELLDPNWQGNIPYTMIVMPGGDVVYRHDGMIDPLEVRKSIIEIIGRYFADDH